MKEKTGRFCHIKIFKLCMAKRKKKKKSQKTEEKWESICRTHDRKKSHLLNIQRTFTYPRKPNYSTEN